MKIKSLVATFALVAATSSVALAKPVVSVQANASWSVGSPVTVVRDHRTLDDDCDHSNSAPVTAAHWGFQRPVYEQPLLLSNTTVYAHSSLYTGPIGTMSQWSRGLIALSQPTRIDNGREDFVIRQGGFDMLQLRGTLGSTYISKVTIDFGDGIGAQVINVNRTLGAGQAFSLDIQGRNRTVKRILVYGSSSHRSAYQLFAA